MNIQLYVSSCEHFYSGSNISLKVSDEDASTLSVAPPLCICVEFKNVLKISMNNGFCKTASVVEWSEFLATDTEVSGSIPGATRFSE